MTRGAAIGFWQTVRLLLGAARQRSKGRVVRQRQLLNSRGASGAINWGILGVIIGAFFMAVIHVIAAQAVIQGVEAGQRLSAEQQGKPVVSNSFVAVVRQIEQNPPEPGTEDADDPLSYSFSEEARRLADRYGGDRDQIEQRLRAVVAKSGSAGLIARGEAEPGLTELGRSPPAATMIGSILLLWWFAMLVCQGEGLELDLQRRRHPMWEWLLGHPVPPGAVFLAEMMAPLSTNPAYWAAPVFAGWLYGDVYGIATGIAAAGVIGVPLSVAAACLGKALEIGAMLRLAPRSRGAAIGIMSWFGFASMFMLFFGLTMLDRLVEALGPHITALARIDWPLLGLFVGLGPDGQFSFLRGALFCWAVSGAVAALAVVFSARSLRNGLSGSFASDTLPRRAGKPARFGRQPLFRKEMLWFIRDRSAIVQTILIPVTLAGFQLFNLRNIVSHAGDSWNFLSGAAILFGTYFLWVLGPKSLVSEGSALWIALTWPRGLESMLKAKAWLWAMISTGIVMAVLLAACVLFPHDIGKIALVAIGWYLFARSMAEKSVTLVTVTSESGEAQKVPTGRRWAAQLGMFSFAIGISTQQWSLAIVGIVYSWVTAAAMWENLRARLPYLYDPWSEVLPPPPTLMHAMVAITVLIECASILTAIVAGIGGKDSLPLAMGIGYALCAVGVSIGTAIFLDGRGVAAARVWCWRANEADQPESWFKRYIAATRQDLVWLALGLGGGIVLGLVAQLYQIAVFQIPQVGETVRSSQQAMRGVPGLVGTYAAIAVLFAPFAEEYLFRGLLFRALDKEWGGVRALLAAATFFAIYHPVVAWLPVATVGAANCLLFKRSGRLAPAVLLHMAYNAVVSAFLLWGS